MEISQILKKLDEHLSPCPAVQVNPSPNPDPNPSPVLTTLRAPFSHLVDLSLCHPCCLVLQIKHIINTIGDAGFQDQALLTLTLTIPTLKH